MLDFESPEDLYRNIVSQSRRPAEIVPGSTEPKTVITDPSQWITYLPDDILVKVDRAAMGVSLETRVPMLDHRIVEFAWRLPLSMKIRDGKNKWILRQVLYRHVPAEIIERPKMGFSVPISDWLRGPLKEWAEMLLDDKRIKEEGILNPGPIRDKWIAHREGKRDWPCYLWDVLMFQT